LLSLSPEAALDRRQARTFDLVGMREALIIELEQPALVAPGAAPEL
jgi:hypothetical protein